MVHDCHAPQRSSTHASRTLPRLLQGKASRCRLFDPTAKHWLCFPQEVFRYCSTEYWEVKKKFWSITLAPAKRSGRMFCCLAALASFVLARGQGAWSTASGPNARIHYDCASTLSLASTLAWMAALLDGYWLQAKLSKCLTDGTGTIKLRLILLQLSGPR
jgi:hypothetical protein